MAQPSSPSRVEAVVATARSPRGRKDDEDGRRLAYRCMMQVHKMVKPAIFRRGMACRGL